MLVDERIVIEVKSTAVLHRDRTRQLYNYLRATDLEVGLFLHLGREPNFERAYCPNHRKQRSSE
jgi:GxxExxY protein